jgi:hypothetical protein
MPSQLAQVVPASSAKYLRGPRTGGPVPLYCPSLSQPEACTEPVAWWEAVACGLWANYFWGGG